MSGASDEANCTSICGMLNGRIALLATYLLSGLDKFPYPFLSRQLNDQGIL